MTLGDMDAGRQILASSRGAGYPPRLRPHPPVRNNVFDTPTATSGASELAERVEQSGRPREAIAGNAPSQTLAFDFEPNLAPAAVSPYPGGGSASPERQFDVSLESRQGTHEKVRLDSISLSAAGHRRSVPAIQHEETVLGPLQKKGEMRSAVEPVITLGSRSASANSDEVNPAPLGKRFRAGVVDAAILAAIEGVFAGSLRLLGGRLQLTPAILAVLGFIAAFWLFAYFAAFEALTFSTPGQAAMGLSIRNFDGVYPSGKDSLLRAFGYLVSTVAFMVGFLWAAMDSDTLAWHDHISGTVLVERELPAERH